MKVLVVDAGAPERFDLKGTLVGLGYEVVGTAQYGCDAARKVASLAPDCVLVDVCVRESDGIASAREVAQMRACPVVVASDPSWCDLAHEASCAGAFGYIAKPIEPKALATVVAVAVGRFNERLALRDELAAARDHIATRRSVDGAKHVLMELGLSENEAFSRMRKASMDTRRPLKDIAEAILVSGKIIGK